MAEPALRMRPGELVLLTGASGYVGGRLLPRLEERGFAVRCLARRPEFLARRAGAEIWTSSLMSGRPSLEWRTLRRQSPAAST